MNNKAIRFLKKIFSGSNPIKIKYTKEGWDTQYKKGNWDFLLKRHENIVIVSRIINDTFLEKKSLKVLDIGCGNGALVRELNQLIHYTGVDISSEALAKAKDIAPHGIYIQQSMDEQPSLSKEEKFDIIIFCEVLLYGDYEKILKLYEPYLASDGFIIVSLYDVWRTRLIWRSIKKQIHISNEVFIKNITRNVGWTVCLGRYNSKNQ